MSREPSDFLLILNTHLQLRTCWAEGFGHNVQVLFACNVVNLDFIASSHLGNLEACLKVFGLVGNNGVWSAMMGCLLEYN